MEPSNHRDKPECLTCVDKNVLLRLAHHWQLYRDRVLAQHLRGVNGEAYEQSGKLERRITFVKDSLKIWTEEWKSDNTRYTIGEAYRTALTRLGRIRSPAAGIERSAPREK